MVGISVCNVDTAGGGLILPGPNAKVFYFANPLAVVGCRVAPHPEGHINTVIETGSSKVFIAGIPVCIQGSRASCGHTATGRPNLTTTA